MDIANGHQAVMPYLMVQNAPAFLDFARHIFHAESTFTKMREDSNTIMHAELQIGGSTIMFCEATDQWKQQPANLFVYVGNADESYKAALELGATNVMEPSDQSYGRTCGIKDPFGNIWWVTSIS